MWNHPSVQSIGLFSSALLYCALLPLSGAAQNNNRMQDNSFEAVSIRQVPFFSDHQGPSHKSCVYAPERQRYGRPILCTEYMARGAGSTFDNTLPIAKRYHVAAINWGLVAGKTQTYFPWDSWQKPYVLQQPTVWFHEVFRQNGQPYRQREVDIIREETGRGTPVAKAGSNLP
jgi:hypothetical protein